MSKVRQNFHTTSEAMINKQINMELTASYVYLAMVRQNIPPPGIIASLIKT